jgi:hypothetical protein
MRKKVRGPAQVPKREHPLSGGLSVFSLESIALRFRRIKPIVMGASFPNPTVFEPLAVESLLCSRFLLAFSLASSCSSRDEGRIRPRSYHRPD